MSADAPVITPLMVDRAERVHNLRCAHRLRREYIAEMLLAATDVNYTPPDNAVDVGRTVAQWGTR